MEDLKLFIGGKWIDGHSGKKIEVENPATRKIIGTVPQGDQVDVENAVNAAKKGYEVWKKYNGSQRAECLRNLAEYFEEHSGEIANTITAELGAPISMAEDWHVGAAARECRFFADCAENFSYEESKAGYILRREPFGFVSVLELLHRRKNVWKSCQTYWMKFDVCEGIPVQKIEILIFSQIEA